MNIDPFFTAIDNDTQIQEKLKLLADDVFNNNEFLSLIHHQENIYFSELMNLVRPIIEQHKKTFLNKNAYSYTGRINYPHIYSICRDDKEAYFLQNISKWMIICLSNEKQKHNIDYIKQLLNHTSCLPAGVELAISKDGLVDLSAIQNSIKLLDHAIDLQDGRRIYLHQFLRRHFNSNFVDIPQLLNISMQQGAKVEARIDPFRVGEMLRYKNIMECDAWYGPNFSSNLLEAKDKREKVTIHHFNGDNPREKNYNKYVTIFRTSMLDIDSELRQFFVEEYIPRLDWLHSPMSSFCGEYVIQRFAHFVYDQKNKNYEHIDCAIRIIDRKEYAQLYTIANQGNDPGGRVGKRFKLFKVTGGINYKTIEGLLYAFFRYNIQLYEYFQNMAFEKADRLLHLK